MGQLRLPHQERISHMLLATLRSGGWTGPRPQCILYEHLGLYSQPFHVEACPCE